MYPDIQFIRDETGEDLLILLGTELKAKAEIKQYVNTLLGELRVLNLLVNYNKIKTLIETDSAWNAAWKKAVASFVYLDYNTQKAREEIAREVIERDPLLSIRNVRL